MIEIATKKNWVAQVGIHKGDVIAAVVGFHKPQFSLIGTAVNTTSRHASKGKAGSVNISEEIYDHIMSIREELEAENPDLLNVQRDEYRRICSIFKGERKELKGLGWRKIYSTPSQELKNYALRLREYLKAKLSDRELVLESQQKSGGSKFAAILLSKKNPQ